ncbi:glycosyltransferase family 4 protein [Roseibium marinum]|uniref:Glycosyltransferase involved in cell wall biosynthesis n=1 Tax=Roseibium marinum TaxID=281252 RepID=A0A2S3UTP1_9HYPH|nr:glycosyltransferase family 4 protein [Roseibium marinum]POF31092.1 glycosyltransferase involved in cell wall biosynthesis [Roseibium marinum]
MRVLHLLNHSKRLNGHVHAAVDLSCAQKKQGHEVSIASGSGDFDDLLKRQGVERFEISHERRPFTLLKSLWKLFFLVRKWKPDVIHAHMMTSAVLAWPVCKLLRIPLVTTVHNEFEKSADLMRLGDRVIAVSQAVRDSMERRGVPASKLRVVLNGTIGSARFEERDDTKADLKHPAILIVAGLHPRKGLTYLLEAFDSAWEKYPAANLYIVGSGPHELEYREKAAAQSSSGNITFLGGQNEPFKWMEAADIFVLPSLADPAPLVICEAREAGCAVIGSDAGGIPQLLEYGEAGLIVPAQNSAALAEELCKLLAEPQTLAEWKKRSQIRISYLTVDRVALQTCEIYANIRGSFGKSAIEPDAHRMEQ